MPCVGKAKNGETKKNRKKKEKKEKKKKRERDVGMVNVLPIIIINNNNNNNNGNLNSSSTIQKWEEPNPIQLELIYYTSEMCEGTKKPQQDTWIHASSVF